MTTRTTTNRLVPFALGLGIALATTTFLRKRRTYDLRNKVVLITGGARGLGLVMARQLAKEGAKLAICARSTDQLETALHQLTALGAEVMALPCDVANQTDVEQLVERILTRFGRIDVLINNASVIQLGPFDNTTLQDYHEAMDINFFGSLHTIMAVVPQMRERKEGRIVNISSVGGKVGLPHLLPYSASKYAIGGFSKGLRSELAKDGIVVTTIFPGLLRTGSPRNAIIKGQHQDEYAWFKWVDSAPFLSAVAEDAAAEIITALKNGRAELVITLSGKLIAIFNELFPELTTNVFGLVNRFLPKPAANPNPQRKGYQSESSTSHQGFNKLSDQAAVRNNEF
ncbi:MAG: SDR family NAD(P)-dependent oxidoreductase [Cytophagaceae bacterium]|nr:SDR family NAD(P)-dependent oxidoreductase [Cytophagaceae bacterium]